MLNTSCLEKLLTFFYVKFQNFQLITVHAKNEFAVESMFSANFCFGITQLAVEVRSSE